MAGYTYAQIFAACRFRLDDTDLGNPGLGVAGTGQVYTDGYLGGFLMEAGNDLFRAFANFGIQEVEKEAVVVVPRGTGSVTPAKRGLPNFSTPVSGWIRKVETSTVIPAAGVTTSINGNLLLPVADSSGFANQDFVWIAHDQRFNPSINTSWFIEVPSPTEVLLMGCDFDLRPAPERVGAQDALLIKPEIYEYPCPIVQYTLPQISQLQSLGNMGMQWRESRLWFTAPPSEDIILRLVYKLSGSFADYSVAGSMDSVIGYDDAMDFLVNRTCQLAALAKGNIQAAKIYGTLACGPSGDPMCDSAQLGGNLKALVSRELGSRPPLQKSRFRQRQWNQRYRWYNSLGRRGG